MFDVYLHRQCTTLGECFVLAGKDNWDSKDFVKKLFKSQWGKNILNGVSTNEYTCEAFMYEGLVRELGKKEGKVYPEKILRYAGYLYRYFAATSNMSLSEIYKRAPLSLIEKRYGFYHTQGEDYVKIDLGIE